MNSALRRLLVPLLRDVKAGKPMKFRHRSAASQALYLVGKPSPSRKAPAQARKLAKAATHREETGAIREAVFRRAQSTCELCCSIIATEMHHLEGGSGRRALQRVSNCVAACWVCHRGFHSRPEAYRAVVEKWAAKWDYPIPRRFRGDPKVIA